MTKDCDILVIEDHEDIREGLAITLALEGYTVEKASDGLEALAKLHAGLRPRLIITDLMMPMMNGFEFRRAQLADPDLAEVPLIAYSAVTDPSESAQHLYADAYLYKPTDMAATMALVRQFCPKLNQGASAP
jgi:CheY-like chemotaxis protein